MSRCVKFEESNDKSQLIFGSMSILPARDAAAVKVQRVLFCLITQYSYYFITNICANLTAFLD